ncbi:DNA-binding domain-containing protein [Psychromonas sp.]|uniref:DNA-binding domain-containing protein n=1 Tax=Psychromonas sp. TaxID=1884585 RepID=UPI0039E63A9F
MKINKLQQQFSETLLYKNDLIASEIQEKEHFSSNDLLQLYRNSFVMGVTEALAVTYQHTLSLVGEDFFNTVARQFILTQPPRENNIINYGNGFSGFLQNLPQLKSLPYIAEMARFEWCLEQTSNAQLQSEPLDIEKLAALPATLFATIIFNIPSQVSLFVSEQDIYRLYQMIVNDKVEETDLNSPCYLALKKQADFNVELIELSVNQYALLQQISNHRTLSEITPADLHQFLPVLLEKELLNGFTVKETS